MKRLTEEEKQKYQKLAQRRMEHDLLRRAKRKDYTSQITRIRRLRKERYALFTEPIHSLKIPSDCSLRSNYDQLVSTVHDLRELALNRRLRVGLDFADVETVGPAAALYLAAEVYRCRYMQRGQKRVTGKHPTDGNAARLLKEMGFNKLLEISDPPIGADQARVQYIQFSTSNRVEGTLAAKLREALEAGSSAIAPESRKAMYGGLTEAMANVLHHAYPAGAGQRTVMMSGRWWMAGSIDHESNQLMIMFYDQGIGIPATLPRKHPMEIWGGILSSLGLRPDDGNMIKVATMLGRTGTEEEHRGWGLQDVLRIVQIAEEGEVRILSGRGEYIYHSDNSNRVRNHRRDIGGTLIEWRVSRSTLMDDTSDDHQDN